MKKVVLNIFVLILSTSFVQAQYTEIDLRTNLNGNKNYVGIAARDNTLTGHTFVIFGKENDQQQMSEMSVQGFYPKREGMPFDIGEVKNDFESLKYVRNSEEEIFFIVNDNDFDAAVKTAREWIKNPPNFNLVNMNCIDFTQHVAKAMGVTLPLRMDLSSMPPARYLRSVKNQLYSQQGLEYKNKTRVVHHPSEDLYIGPLKNGKAEGKGRSVSVQGIYIGEFKNGEQNGEGISYSKTDGSIISGKFQNGHPVSPIKTTFPDGTEVVQTNDVNGMPLSQNYTLADGSKGSIIYNSKGTPETSTLIHPNRKKETLSFDENVFPTSGTISSPQGGELIIKKFYKNNRDSMNIHLEENGTVFEGDIWYQSGHSYEKGSIKYSTGDTYDGELKDFRWNGRGRLVHHKEKDCAFLGLFCSGEGFDITDDFTDGTSPFLQNLGIPPAPSKSFPDPNEWKVPINQDPQAKPQENSPRTPGISPEDTNDLDPIPAGRTPRPTGYNNHNSYWNPVKGKWELL